MHSLITATSLAAFTSFARATSKGKNAALLLFSVAVLLAGGTVAARGQSALDGFDPNANGQLFAVVVQPDGKILLGGGFSTLSPNGGAAVTRVGIARLNPDGTLDPAFNPNTNGYVESMALQADGKILVGGYFTSIGGQTRHSIARLDPTTGLADSFDPNAINTFEIANIYAITVQADGKILVGGVFTSIGGQTRRNITRLDPTTGLADSFDPNASDIVWAIAVQADGKILAGGDFMSIGGQTRHSIARLDAVTGLADSFNPNADRRVVSIAAQADGKILVGGEFTSIGGQTRNRIARLDAGTGLADGFNPNANDRVVSVAVQADGRILAGGEFTSIGGQTRNRVARLDATTGLADSFDPNASCNQPCRGAVAALVVQADGKVLAGGNFNTLAPNGGAALTRNYIARLEVDGRLDQTLDLSIGGGDVRATAVQPDGKTLIGGGFTTVLGVARNDIARLNTDGTLDTAFDPNANGEIESIAVQADGKILVGGAFTTIGGQTRNRIARLDATTGLADSFNPNADGLDIAVNSIAVQADGKIIVTGSFETIGGQARNHMARLDATTGLADSFDPSPNFDGVNTVGVQADGKILTGGQFAGIGQQFRNSIARLDATTGLADSFDPQPIGIGEPFTIFYAVAVQADGKILATGEFRIIGGQTRMRIARLDPATGLADSFDPNASSGGSPHPEVSAIAVQSDGEVLAGGEFTNIGGQGRNYIARLDATSGLADSFDPGANGPVLSIAVQADGKILVSGQFGSIGGQARNSIARLSNNTAALQNLAVTQSAITWTRGGSGPQFARVTFEYSTDNVNYTPLGNGTAAGSNWTLTGLSLPIGQGFYIRARGYYRGGYRDNSDSIAESVRNAFLAGPTPINISGTISYCWGNPNPGPVPNTTLTLSGGGSGSTLSNGSGGYQFSSLASGGTYTITPGKTALEPGSAGISTVDVIAVQRQFLNMGTPLSGCKLMAADVNGDTLITTADVIAIQRFVLIFHTGIANVGKYQFTPANRTYSGIGSNQTAQDYDTLVFGDVAGNSVHRSGRPAN